MALRHYVKSISPVWLSAGVAERYLYDCGLALDAVVEKFAQAARAGMPTKCDPTCLPHIGADRLMPQGLTESDDSYRVRLQQAIDTWRIAGNPWSVLRQTLAYLLAFTPRARIVASDYFETIFGLLIVDSAWDTFEEEADTSKPPTHDFVAPANFDWDRLSPVFGSWGNHRYWLILYSFPDNEWVLPGPNWGDTGRKWGDTDVSWGLNVPKTEIDGIRAIVGLVQSAGAWCRYIIVSFSDTLFDPAQPVGGAVNPDGYFGRHSKIVNGAYVPARFSDARYCKGIY